jgi:nicotinate-nucleotide--dimethylbenzimidazole phosphoribosyltransferase
MRRPLLGPELDPRARPTAPADPRGWRLDDAARAALATVIDGRRDVRRFRPDPVDDARAGARARGRAPRAVRRAVAAWALRRGALDGDARARARAGRARARAPGARASGRGRGPSWTRRSKGCSRRRRVCVCCVAPPEGTEVLGRATIPATDIYSTACAIQNLWLTARAEGLGVGWVSFYRPAELRAVLGHSGGRRARCVAVRRMARRAPVRPGLERAGWASGARWPTSSTPSAGRRATRRPRPRRCPTTARASPPRDRADRLVKPAEASAPWRTSSSAGARRRARRRRRRCAPRTCSSPPTTATRRGGRACSTGAVSGQVAAAAARGETAIGVLARATRRDARRRRRRPARPDPGGLRRPPLRRGTADFVDGPAMTACQRHAALAAGPQLAARPARGERRRLPRPRRDRHRQHRDRPRPAVRAHGRQPDEVVGRGTRARRAGRGAQDTDRGGRAGGAS